MNELTDLIDRYIAGWNEQDAERRRALIARTWTDDARYVDPVMQSEGHDGIETMIQGVQERFPGYRFRRTGEVEAHNDRLRFTWDLAPEDGEAVVAGTDFGIVTNGKLQAITGFFDRAPGA